MLTVLVVVAALLVFAFVVVPLVTMGWMMGGFAFTGMMGMGWWLWAVVALLIGLVVLALVAALRPPGAARREGSALRLLEERYARGEIGREEYERTRSDLRRSA